MINFTIHTEFIELHKLLKVTNLASSGGEAKVLISSGLVKVDGQTETRKGCKIRPGQIVEFSKNKITVSAKTE